MLTGKQRSFLKSLSHNKKPLAQIGKEGMSDAFLAQMDELLEHHEVVKVNVLEMSLLSAKDAANEVAQKLDAEFVQAIGNKFTIYRQSRTNPTLAIPGADNSRVHNNNLKKLQIEREKEIKKGKVSTGKRIRKTVRQKSTK